MRPIKIQCSVVMFAVLLIFHMNSLTPYDYVQDVGCFLVLNEV